MSRGVLAEPVTPSMKLTYDVPESVQRCAARALAFHKEHPLADVGGIAVAEALASGLVTLDVIGKLHRFFQVNSRVYAAESQLMRTEADSALVRSWLMYGAESGRRWAEDIYRKAVAEGYRPADAVTDLFQKQPDDIYAAFSIGAWRFEYDLDPRKAARFVEEYHRATGWNLDLRRAFGDSSPSVSTALYRRFHPVDPFREAARCLTVEDVEYKFAAQVDLAELTHSVDALEEGLKPTVFTAPAAMTAKLVWPAFVAYVILAAEKPELLVAMNKASKKPPSPDQKPSTYASYHDAINTFVTFFHPNGSRFVDPMKAEPETAKVFGSLPEEMFDLMVRAYYGRHITPVSAQKLLGKARRWTAENKFAGSLFHVFNADWKKGNWEHILDNIPLDADVRPAFAEFTKANPMPSGGVKLQQTLSDKGYKEQVAKYFAKQKFIEAANVDLLDAVKIDDTLTGEKFQKLGTPLGVYSVIQLGPSSIKQWVVLGAFKTDGNVVRYVFMDSKDQTIWTHALDTAFALNALNGEVSVALAHKDMPGSAYGTKAPSAPKQTSAKIDPDAEPELTAKAAKAAKSVAPKEPTLPDLTSPWMPTDLIEYLIQFGWMLPTEVATIKSVEMPKTLFAKAAKAKYGITARAKQVWTHKSPYNSNATPEQYEVVGAWSWGSYVHIVMKGLLGESTKYIAVFDGHLEPEVKAGNWTPPPKAPQPEPAPTDVSAIGKPTFDEDLATVMSAINQLANVTNSKSSDWTFNDPSKTVWADVVKAKFQMPVTFGQQWKDTTHGSKTLRLLNGIAHPKHGKFVVFSHDGPPQSSYTLPDETLAVWTKLKDFVPMSADLSTASTPLTQTPTAPPAKPELAPWKFQPGDVVKWDDGLWYVPIGSHTGEDVVPSYIVTEIKVVNGEPKLYTTVVMKSVIEDSGSVHATYSPTTPYKLFDQFPFAPNNKLSSNDAELLKATNALSIGDHYTDGGKVWTVAGYCKRMDESGAWKLFRVATALEKVETFGTEVTTVAVQTKPVADAFVKSSYTPPVMAPQLPHEADEPDPEAGAPEMSGTKAALDWLGVAEWKPAKQSQSEQFLFPLGSVQKYGADKTRLIVGYAFGENGSPTYVIKTEKGNLNWVTCKNAHAKYGPMLSMDQATIDALVPLPGEEKPVFPKLNYKLSSKAKELAQKNNLLYVPAPKEAHYYVNTPLLGGGGEKVVLVGWAKPKLQTIEHAVIFIEPPQEHAPDVYYYETIAKLNADYSLRFANDTKWDSLTGEITFGKKPNQQHFSAIINSATIPSEPPEGWDEPESLKQPPAPVLDKGKHMSAGIIAIVPAGASFNVKGEKIQALPFASVVLYHPLGNYGGYKLNIPKGTVDQGESLLKTAVREFHEETGLTAKPVAYLGDFRGNQSVTRLYVGYVTGGNPYKKKQPEECDAVTFKPLVNLIDEDGSYKKQKWYGQLVPTSGNKWQQDAIDAVAAWLLKNGSPHQYPPEIDTSDSTVSVTSDTNPYAVAGNAAQALKDFAQAAGVAVTGAQQAASAFDKLKSVIPAPPPADWAPNIPPTQLEGGDPWKALLFKAPFAITSTMVELLKARAKEQNTVPVSFDVSRTREARPPYGAQFETAAGSPYVCAGYVTWLDTNNHTFPYMLALTEAGAVVVLPATNGIQYKVSSDQSLANGIKTAWYTHPDPTINAVIQKVAQSGKLPDSVVNMKTFKESWMKEAGLPAYSVVTANILRDVASLFVPGACSQVVRDTILMCLKSRMKATHSGKKVEGAPIVPLPTTVPEPTQAKVATPAAPVVPPTPQTTVLPTGPLSPILKQYVTNPQPHLFSATGQKVKGGSKPNALLNGPGGKQWFAKWVAGEPFRPYVDRAAYQLSELCKPNNIPVGVMDFDGKTVSFQPYAADAQTVPSSPLDLSEANMAELLSQHAVDMFMGDHDGHAGNWISVGGKIIAVDRGQAFKFLLMGQADSLDPSWHAPGNVGDGYAKRLLLTWGKDIDTEIPEAAWAAMLKTIRSIAKISDAQLEGLLTPVFDALSVSTVTERKGMLQKLAKRRDSYEKDWTTVLRGLRKSFVWPKIGAVSAPAKAFTSSPEELGFGKREEKVIAEAVAAKWQGKSIQIGGTDFENQEVMVRRVMWEEKTGLKVPATMIHFRVSRPAGIKAAKQLYSSANLEVAETLGGPQRLKVDQMGSYWEKIYAAVKTLNHHLYVKKDTAVNMATIQTMVQLRPTLDGLLKIAADASGMYTPTNEPNEAVYAMAEQYLQYLGIVEYWVAKKEELVGQHSPKLVEFLWEPPVPDHAISKDAPPYKVSLKKQGALWPTAVPVGQEVHVTNLNKPVMNSASQSQFVIEDPLTKARIFWNPPGGLSGTVEYVKDGVETLKGQGWAIVPGEPDKATVAHLLKLFSAATGLNVRAADAEDAEFLYWSRQANVLQGGGIVQPKSDHTSVIDPGYAAAISTYESGSKKLAIEVLQKWVANHLKKPVEEVKKLATPAAIAGEYTRGAGFLRHTRIGWTRDSLSQAMGKTCHLAHHLADTPLSWMQAMQSNGALLSNAIKAYYGVTKTGASPGQDMNVGGGQGLFLCFRKDFSSSSGMIYFDISLALRLDVYIVGKGDSYGATNSERYTTPEQWIALGANKGTGACGASSSLQVNIRHDIDLQQYLVRVICGSASDRAGCIKIANSLGWTFYGGATPETVFTVGA